MWRKTLIETISRTKTTSYFYNRDKRFFIERIGTWVDLCTYWRDLNGDGDHSK